MEQRERISQFYRAVCGWEVPWNAIRIRIDGWFWRLSRLFVAESRAATFCIMRPYEIHACRDCAGDCELLVHEVAHVWQREKHGFWFIIAYCLEYVRTGYRLNRYEKEAYEIEERFRRWDGPAGQQ